jgi:hypothetical protein
LLAAYLASVSRSLNATKLVALWITSALAAAVVWFVCGTAADRGPKSTKALMVILMAASALYILVSGSALILWRLRRREG